MGKSWADSERQSLGRLDSDAIVHRVPQPLFSSRISLSRLAGEVIQQELNLAEFCSETYASVNCFQGSRLLARTRRAGRERGTLGGAIEMTVTSRINLAVDDSGRTLSIPLYTAPMTARILTRGSHK